MLGTMDNDAKSCYDRIICNFAMIVSRYYGMPLNACKLQATTLLKIVFSHKTGIGLSKNTYQHSDNTPIYGSGQGSCASPCIWLLISSLLMDYMEKNAQGMEQERVSQMDPTFCQWIDEFVDDTSVFSNKIVNNNDLSELSRQLQEDSEIWANLLAALGGKLELDKCFYYLLTWKFDKNGDAEPETMNDQLGKHCPITIKDERNNKTLTIRQKEISDPHKTLGIMENMSGCEKAQVEYLKDKRDKFAAKVSYAKLSRHRASIAYRTMYVPSMTYGLPATNLTETDLNKIQSKTAQTCLSACRYKKTFPHAFVYGNKQFGGLRFAQLYTEKCVVQIKSLITHIRAKTTLG